MRLKTSIKEVVCRLINADMSLQPAENDLFHAQFFELFYKRVGTARAECGLFINFETFRQNSLYLVSRFAQAFRILLGDDHRDAENLKSANSYRGPLSNCRKIRNNIAKGFLDVNDH